MISLYFGSSLYHLEDYVSFRIFCLLPNACNTTMATTQPTLRDLLYLLTIPNIGPGRIRRLFSSFHSVAEIQQASLQQLLAIPGFDRKLVTQIRQGGDWKTVDHQLQQLQHLKIHHLSIWDPRYPPLLKQIPDAPVVLFYKGKLPDQWPLMVAVVGTRSPSTYGKTVAERFVKELVQAGIAIVSGFARGIDTIAHSITLREGGFTIAVLGNGLDRIYPAENRQLFEMMAHKGLILTEFLLGTGPDAVNFPRRNRIISGLCQGVLVVEAGQKSGAMITADYALQHNREVFAIPGPVTAPRSAGTNRLIQQGAKLVQNLQDILDELPPFDPKTTNRTEPDISHLHPRYQKILNVLSFEEPRHIDQLVLQLQDSPATLLGDLLQLELQGFVKQLSGKLFIRIT